MKFSHSVLDNGLNVVTDYIPEAKVASIHWILRAGARHDATSGTAHFFEHMFCSSLLAKDGGDVIKRFMDISPNANFATGPEWIEGYANVLPEYGPEIIQTLGKIVTKPVWNAEIFERQRGLILNEYDEQKRSAPGSLHVLTLKKIYAGHPVERSVLGDRKNIERMTEANLVAYMEEHFMAGDMALVVSGPMTHEDVLSHASQSFNRLHRGKNPAQRRPVGHSGQYGLIITTQQEQAVRFVSPGLSAVENGYHASVQMMHLLWSGLDNFLRDEGHSYEGIKSCYAAGFSDFGMNVISFFTSPEKAAHVTREAALFIASPEHWLKKDKFDFMHIRARTADAAEFLNPSERATSIVSDFSSRARLISYEDTTVAHKNVDFDSVVAAYNRFKSTPLSVLGYGPRESLPSPEQINKIVSGCETPGHPMEHLDRS